MKTYKAFFLNELIIFKRSYKYFPIFFLIAIGAVLAPYLNQYNFSGIHFSQQFAGYIAFITLIFGLGMFSSVYVMSSIAFEKADGLHLFLFSYNINKKIYIISKLTIPLILSILGSVIPLYIYYGTEFYKPVPVHLPVAIIYIICINAIWTLISILCGLILNKIEDITLSSFAIMIAIIIGLCCFISPWKYPMLSCFIIIILVVILFFIIYRMLNNREVSIQIEKIL